MISHIVLFQPKAGLTEDQILLFAQQFKLVMDTVPGISRGQVGRSVDIYSGEDRNLGDKAYSFAAVLEFEDAGALVSYLHHPEHRKLGRLFWEYCDSTVVMEAETVDVKAGSVVSLLVKKQN